MARPRTKEYVTYSFKCLIGRDDQLIEALNNISADRSQFIRDTLCAGMRMPKPLDRRVMDVETLRIELAAAVDTILENLPQIAVIPAQQKQPRRAGRDVNETGRNIPDF